MKFLDNLEFRSKYKLYPLIFVGGFVSLALQIHAGRLLDIYHGGTTVTWGSVLSVFMITLGFGYYISGKRAKKATLRRLLYYGIAYAFSMIIPIAVSGPYLSVADVAYIDHPFFTSMIIYGVPSLIIGFLSPYSVEIIQERDGEAAGDIYSLSTLGSIFGALSMTFILIPQFGIFESVIIMTFMTVISLIPLYYSTDTRYISLYILVLLLVIITMTGAFAGPKGNIIYETQSQYHEIVVSETEDNNRYLQLSGSPSSALDMNDTDNYIYSYYKLLHTPALYYEDEQSIDEVLVIGGGAGVLPNRYAEKYNASVDVVEIDPEVKRVAYEYFEPRREDVEWHISDGRVFLENTNNKYDVIVLNAYKNPNSLPIHLTTREFYQLTEDALDNNGVVASNVISSLEGENGLLTRSIARTKDTVYPETKLYYEFDPSGIQNIIIVSSYQDYNESVLYSRTEDRFTGGLESSGFEINRISDLNLNKSQILEDESVSEYELLPPDIRDFTYDQERYPNQNT